MKEVLIAVSGIILFLVGMIRLSSAVRKMVNVRIKEYVKYAVEKPFFGLVTGMLSAVLFQSSSASTALTISLVSAGLITFYSSLAIMLGADIGTTLTVQFVIWRFTDFSPLIVSIGGLLWMTRRGRLHVAGELIFYFGLIFFGLELVSQAVLPLKESPAFVAIFTQTKSPLFGIGLGMVVTAVVQASAIPISILALLAQQEMVSLENALPVVMGANIGTTVTALLAGTVANINGKRSAAAQLIFKCTGVLICLLLMPHFISLLKDLSPSTAQQIALAHLFINLVIVLVFIFLLKPFAMVMQKMLPGEGETLPVWPEFINSKDAANPYRALASVQKELQRQVALVLKMFTETRGLMKDYQEVNRKNVAYVGMVVNNLRAQIVKFLLKVSARHLSAHHAMRLFVYTAMAGDIESMGTHVSALSRLAAEKAEGNIPFSDCGEEELDDIYLLVGKNIEDALALSEEADPKKIQSVFSREALIDVKVKQSRDNHLQRFFNRQCRASAGPIFVEMLIHLERISDHCNNIAEHVSDLQ
ncbi:MAG: Na/Pi cotransporter family protein [Smithellaceae bacterium]